MTPTGAIPLGGARAWPPGWSVRCVAETGSTNEDLLRDAADLPDRSVLATRHQTAGRGRLDRRWQSPPGANLMVSALFHHVPDPPWELTRRVGLAAVEAARQVAGVAVDLKWPNDLLIGDAKAAGILAQRGPTGAVVVGLGLNIGWAPDGSARLGDGIDPLDVLYALLSAYDALPADITRRYRDSLATLGRRVRVLLPAGADAAERAVVGTATDVDTDGRLVVVDECAVTHRFDVGDIVHLRPA